MKGFLVRLSVYAILVVVSISCRSKIPDKNAQIAYVNDVEAPATGTIRERLQIPVKFTVNNGCGSFNRFVESQNGTTRTIAVEATYTDGICTQALETKTVNYSFQPSIPGTYQLEFKSSPSESIRVAIKINP